MMKVLRLIVLVVILWAHCAIQHILLDNIVIIINSTVIIIGTVGDAACVSQK